MDDPVRSPAVAGQFYYGDTDSLLRQVEQYVSDQPEKTVCIGVVSPHAGFMYSGAVAGSVDSHVTIPETVLMLGPNHTGLGNKASLMDSGTWEIPMGLLEIDEEFASRLCSLSAELAKDKRAHLFEHSLEVQLPFLMYFRKDVTIVPITFMHMNFEECRELGTAIASAIQETAKEVLIVASSDMSHYLPDNVARQKDKLAIDKMLDLDPEGLYDVVKRFDISMCGYIPATIMLCAASILDAQEAKLVKYATSAEISGDYDQVVGYAGIIVR